MNHSGSANRSKRFQNQIQEDCFDNIKNPENLIIEEKNFSTNENEKDSKNIESQFESNTYSQKNDEIEINRIMKTFEKMKINDPELFEEIMYVNKDILDLCSKENSTRDDIKLLEEHYRDLEEIDEDFLFWCSHKSISKAIIENKNLDIAHFILVKKAYKLYNKTIHKNILHDYIKSLCHLEIDDENFSKYTTILDFMLNYAKADINERDDGLQNSPLHYAVLFKQIEFIGLLLANKELNINNQNKYGDTPLDFVLESYQRGEDRLVNGEIIKLLLSRGGEANNLKEYLSQLTLEDENEEDN